MSMSNKTMMTMTTYVARAALANLADNGQGCAVLDDSVWDEIYEQYPTNKEAARTMACANLATIVMVLFNMGIPKDDEELNAMIKMANADIDSRMEDWGAE